jgi:Radical SAM superfamily/Iron-sulfur cluster-binding domain
MPDSKIFCNIPWFEININHDGSYDLCGCQNDKIVGTEQGKVYNIKQIPIKEYWNGHRLQEARLRKLGNTPDSMCKMCQQKESVGYASNRIKENLKSVIFNESFDRSYLQSPNYSHFKYSEDNHGLTDSHIHSLHVNLGNICNFACRMCGPSASTRLQTEFLQLGWIQSTDRFTHWTDTEAGWNNFLKFLEEQAINIKVIHIIGGEVEFMPKFEFLIDYFITAGLASTVNISFTSNGSVDYSKYFEKLKHYKRCELGISIESVEPIGDYIRQGGNILSILNNIQQMNLNRPTNMQLVIRTVPSLLSLPTYASLIKWALDMRLPMDNSVLVSPIWQQAVLLPDNIKSKVVDSITAVLDTLPATNNRFNNQKDPNNIEISIRNECESIISLAQKSLPDNATELRTECATKLSQWDQMKRISLQDYSADLYNFLSEFGYCA